MSLADAQHALWSVVRDDQPVNDAPALFAGAGKLSAAAGLRLYQRMYWSRQVSALTSMFELTARALGQAAFAAHCRAAIAARPSMTHALEHLGAGLPTFLATCADVPRAVVGVAELERARTVAAFALDAHGVPSLTHLRPELIARSSLRLTPSVTLVSVQAGGPALWARLQGAPETPEIPTGARDPATVPVVVWRKRDDFSVCHVTLDDDEADALRRARAGQALQDVLDAFGGSTPERAAAALGSWFRRGFVNEVVRPSALTRRR